MRLVAGLREMIWQRVVVVVVEGAKLGGREENLLLTSRMVVQFVVIETNVKMHVLTWGQLEIGWHQAGVAGEEVDRVGHQDRVVAGMVNF